MYATDPNSLTRVPPRLLRQERLLEEGSASHELRQAKKRTEELEEELDAARGQVCWSQLEGRVADETVAGALT